jgi:anti-sigma factor ChrR (cupin superfamily)
MFMHRTGRHSEGSGADSRWPQLLAELFDVPLAFSLDLNRLLDDPSCWMLSERAEIRVIRIPPGEKRRDADAMLLRAGAGVGIPNHVHHREEHTLVLRGMLEESGGRLVHPGELLVKAPGSEHALRAIGDEECICAVLWVRREA